MNSLADLVKQESQKNMNGLSDLIKQESRKNLNGLTRLVKSESEKSQQEMAVMVKNAFQGNQEYMDNRFDVLTTEMRGGFEIVNKEINKINLNAVDVVRKEDFDKLESRMVDVEEIVNLQLKKG